MRIIELSGKSGSGKDAVANVLKKELTSRGERVKITHFADLLKWMCKKYCDWDGKKDEYGRTILQWIGTDYVREIYDGFWIYNVLMGISFAEMMSYTTIIIPDVRFKNEIDEIRSCHTREQDSVIHIAVERDCESTLTEDQQKHISENALEDVTPDIVFDNNCGIEEMKQRCADLVDSILNNEASKTA